MLFLTISWLFLIILFLMYSRNLLILLLLLELVSFLLLTILSFILQSQSLSDYYIIILFSLFVIEGVIAISGLICLVSFSGNDYLLSSSVLNF